MQFIFDHIYAILIASVIFLILIVNQMRTLEASIEDTSLYQSKTDVLDFAEVIEDDIIRTMWRSNQAADPFVWPVTNVGGRTTLFEFYSDSLDAGTTVIRNTRYTLTFVDSLREEGTSLPLYKIVREVCEHTGAGCIPTWDGESAPWVKDFDIEPLQLDKSPATSVTNAYYLKISFIMSPPFRTNRQVVDKLQWSSLLQIQNY